MTFTLEISLMKYHSASILRLGPASHTNCMPWGVTSALGVTNIVLAASSLISSMPAASSSTLYPSRRIVHLPNVTVTLRAVLTTSQSLSTYLPPVSSSTSYASYRIVQLPNVPMRAVLTTSRSLSTYAPTVSSLTWYLSRRI